MTYKELLYKLQHNTSQILTYVETERFDILDELFDEREKIIYILSSANDWDNGDLEELDSILNASFIVQKKLEMAKQRAQKEVFSISRKNKAINQYKANEI